MTEDEARAALRAFVGIGDLEPWIAWRPWQAGPGGWPVSGELQGWRLPAGARAGWGARARVGGRR
jgi:hypothetical protein